MEVWKLVFSTLILTDCYLCTKAQGVCGFAKRLPYQENVESEALITAGLIDKKTEQSYTTKSYTTTTGQTTDTTTITCPANMVYSNCSTCQGSCSKPGSCIQNCSQPQTCICPNGFLLRGSDCIPEEECGCFVVGKGVLPNNGIYINETCTEKCVCQDDQLICNSSYECSPNATCGIKAGARRCYCNKSFIGDGTTCTRLPKDCYDALQNGHTRNGVYFIFPGGWPGSSFQVYCDMTTDGGGWTVFLRRVDGETDFYRNWESYKNGFGSLNNGKDFWLGNEQLFYLTNTNQRTYKLRVDIVTSLVSQKNQEYSSFRIDDESTKYKLVDIGTTNGTAGDGMQNTRDRPFSTYNSDNDICPFINCAMEHRGAWWHYSTDSLGKDHCMTNCSRRNECNRFTYGNDGCTTFCSASNLNGAWHGVNGKNIHWNFDMNCNLMYAEMKIRP